MSVHIIASSVNCRHHRAARVPASLLVVLLATGLYLTVTSPEAFSQAPGRPQVAGQGAGTSQGVAELSLTTSAGTVTNEVLTGFSLSVSTGSATPSSSTSASSAVVVTATMQVDSVSVADLLEATLEDTVYKSALITPHNLAVSVSCELGEPSITAHTLQSGASGALVQVVLAAKSFQVVIAPKFGGRGWTATAAEFEGQNGQRYAYECPVPGPNDNLSGNDVWGTTTYTDDSSVCTAAVNYGLITFESGGTVTIEMRAGLASYTGSNRNGTTTESSGRSTGSFVFIGQPIYNTDVGYGGRGWDAYPSSFPAKNGQRYLYICPPKGSPQEIFGTGTYTTDSPVCTAAVQEGLITLAKGGYVTIEIKPGIGTYTGSTKNGITSSSGAWSYGSYIFVTS